MNWTTTILVAIILILMLDNLRLRKILYHIGKELRKTLEKHKQKNNE